MKYRGKQQAMNLGDIMPGMYLFTLTLFFLLGGCSIWNGYLDPDYGSSRADLLCHPYGECSQGTWVAIDEIGQDATIAKLECREVVDQRYGNEWWADSVARGLEIGKCMEKKGYRLKQ